MWPMRNLSWMLAHAHTANVLNNNGFRFFRWCVLSGVYCCNNKLHSSCKHRFILHWKGLKYFFRFYQKWKIDKHIFLFDILKYIFSNSSRHFLKHSYCFWQHHHSPDLMWSIVLWYQRNSSHNNNRISFSTKYIITFY